MSLSSMAAWSSAGRDPNDELRGARGRGLGQSPANGRQGGVDEIVKF